MRLEMIRGGSNVVRFPVERRRAPSLELLRDIAPDPREVFELTEAFDLGLPLHELRPDADRAMAERILAEAPVEPGRRRRKALADLLAPLLQRATDLCRRTNDALQAAALAQERLAAARAAGGYWMAPLEEWATYWADTAACLIVEAYAASEEAEGAARAIELALSGEKWQPIDLRAAAEALLLGDGNRAALL
jgi:hypothetical protein